MGRPKDGANDALGFTTSIAGLLRRADPAGGAGEPRLALWYEAISRSIADQQRDRERDSEKNSHASDSTSGPALESLTDVSPCPAVYVYILTLLQPRVQFCVACTGSVGDGGYLAEARAL